MNGPALLLPDWPAPPGVRAAFSLRRGGVSAAPFDALNLGAHTGDAAAAVRENRRLLREALQLPAEPLWLRQVHGTRVLDADAGDSLSVPEADAALTRRAGRVLAVLVADCMPVLLARRDGSAIAVAHAGWRGLAAGVLEQTLEALGGSGESLVAWLGPAIGAAHFEVGEDVREAFCGADSAAATAFVANARGRWQCDLVWLARRRLQRAGLSAIHGLPRCTYSEPDSFYSFRRDRVTGRMAALIWLQPAGIPPA